MVLIKWGIMNMKLKRYLLGICCMLVAGLSFIACDEDDEALDDTGSKVSLPAHRAYILYEGGMGMENSGLAFYAPDGNADFIEDIYQLQNLRKLGDTGLSMVEHDGSVYVVVSGSKYVVRLNAAGVEQCRHMFENTPRYIAAEDGFVYVTQYGGRVSKLDARTLEEVDAFQEGDGNWEGIVEHEGKLYVANAWHYTATGEIEYNKEVLVVNAGTMELEKKITDVAVNPERLWEENDRIYLISRGDYGQVKNQLQEINPYTGSVKHIAEATKLAEWNDRLYLVNTEYDSSYIPSNRFFVYDMNTGEVDPPHSSFLNDDPEILSALSNAEIYLFEVDGETGDIYVGTSDYVSEGKIYRFGQNGMLKDRFDAGGINPNSIVFID